MTLHFPSNKEIGVSPSKLREEFTDHGFLSYAAAQALRWWFIAEQPFISGSVETRLVQHEFKSSWTAKPIRSICLVDPEKREDIFPDWGKKDV